MSKLDILATIRLLPDREFSAKEICDALPEGTPEKANSNSYLYLTIHRLVRDGTLTQTGRGTDARYRLKK